jgi:hypothetical protein
MRRAHAMCAVPAVWALWALWALSGATVEAQTPSEGWAVLAVEEYRALRERAFPPPPPVPAVPVDGTLTRIDYELRPEGESIAGRALLTVDVLREGWARVPIPAGLMVRDARLDGEPVALLKGPPPHVLVSRTGRSVLELDIVIALASSAGTESIVLPPSPAPIVRVSFVLPRGGVDLTVTGGFIAERSESADESRWVAFGRPNQPLAFSWKRKVDDRRAEQTLRIRARVIELAGFGEDGCQVSASVRIEVVQGLAREVEVRLPDTLIVNQVNGATVADWQVASDLLRVRLLEPASSEIAFVIQAEGKAGRDGTLAVPIVRVPAAERESGGIAVDVVGAGEVRGQLARGMEAADPSELGDIVSHRESPSMIAYKLRPQSGSDARSLSVSVVRYLPQPVLVASIDEARYRAIVSEDGLLLVEARYAVRNNQRGFLQATLPQGAKVWSAKVANRPMRPGVAGADAVLVPLEKGRSGEEAPTFVVELVYLQSADVWPRKGRARLTLPAVDLPVLRTGVELYYSPRFRVELEAGRFRLEPNLAPFDHVIRATSGGGAGTAFREQSAAQGLQTLVDRFKKDAGGLTVVGTLPVSVSFPVFGPSLFLAAELTAEQQATWVDLGVKRVSN